MIVIRTDLIVEALGDFAQMGCILKKSVFLLASHICAAVGRHEKKTQSGLFITII